MPKGPFGAPRPMASYRIVVDPHQQKVYINKVGPLGMPRPLAKDNPPVEDTEVAECMMSDAGQSFGAGVISAGATTDISDLSPSARQDALEMTEKWCRGTMEAQAIEDLEEDEALPALTRIRNTLSNQTGEQDNISIEMVGGEEAVEEAMGEFGDGS